MQYYTTDCLDCRGTGLDCCCNCHGEGRIEAEPTAIDTGSEECYLCGGTGAIWCCCPDGVKASQECGDYDDDAVGDA